MIGSWSMMYRTQRRDPMPDLASWTQATVDPKWDRATDFSDLRCLSSNATDTNAAPQTAEAETSTLSHTQTMTGPSNHRNKSKRPSRKKPGHLREVQRKWDQATWVEYQNRLAAEDLRQREAELAAHLLAGNVAQTSEFTCRVCWKDQSLDRCVCGDGRVLPCGLAEDADGVPSAFDDAVELSGSRTGSESGERGVYTPDLGLPDEGIVASRSMWWNERGFTPTTIGSEHMPEEIGALDAPGSRSSSSSSVSTPSSGSNDVSLASDGVRRGERRTPPQTLRGCSCGRCSDGEGYGADDEGGPSDTIDENSEEEEEGHEGESGADRSTGDDIRTSSSSSGSQWSEISLTPPHRPRVSSPPGSPNSKHATEGPPSYSSSSSPDSLSSEHAVEHRSGSSNSTAAWQRHPQRCPSEDPAESDPRPRSYAAACGWQHAPLGYAENSGDGPTNYAAACQRHLQRSPSAGYTEGEPEPSDYTATPQRQSQYSPFAHAGEGHPRPTNYAGTPLRHFQYSPFAFANQGQHGPRVRRHEHFHRSPPGYVVEGEPGPSNYTTTRQRHLQRSPSAYPMERELGPRSSAAAWPQHLQPGAFEHTGTSNYAAAPQGHFQRSTFQYADEGEPRPGNYAATCQAYVQHGRPHATTAGVDGEGHVPCCFGPLYACHAGCNLGIRARALTALLREYGRAAVLHTVSQRNERPEREADDEGGLSDIAEEDDSDGVEEDGNAQGLWRGFEGVHLDDSGARDGTESEEKCEGDVER